MYPRSYSDAWQNQDKSSGLLTSHPVLSSTDYEPREGTERMGESLELGGLGEEQVALG